MDPLEEFNKLYIPNPNIDSDGINGKCIKIPFNDINEDLPSRFCTTIEGALFNCYFHKTSSDVLFVFLPGARGNGLEKLPRFSRWSRSSIINGCTLCIEDPMYYTYPELRYGWFIGTEEVDYTQLLAKLIDKIATVMKISGNRIVLFGSSAGGSVSMNCSQYLPKSIAISINPQYLPLTPKEYDDNFYKTTGVHIEHYSSRINVANAITSDSGLKLLAFNSCSKEDSEMFNLFCQNNNIIPPDGNLFIINNTIVWKFEAPGIPNPHTSYENQKTFPMFLIISSILINLHDIRDIRKYSSIFSYLSNIWYDKYDTILKNVKDGITICVDKNYPDPTQTAQRIRSFIHYGHDWAVPLLLKNQGETPTDSDKIIDVYQNMNVVTPNYIHLLMKRRTPSDLTLLKSYYENNVLSNDLKLEVKKCIENIDKRGIEVDVTDYDEISESLKNNDLTPLIKYIKRQNYG